MIRKLKHWASYGIVIPVNSSFSVLLFNIIYIAGNYEKKKNILSRIVLIFYLLGLLGLIISI